jgi:hypothetical protein
MHTVPKPNSDKLRLVVDHTAGEYSLNSMIDRDAIKGTKLDGLHSLGASLLRFREQHPNVQLVMFKSDVSQAFRRLPMHPHNAVTYTRMRRTAKGDNVPIETDQPTWAHGNNCTMIDEWAEGGVYLM